MPENIALKKLRTLADFRQVVEIQKAAWDQTDLEIIPEHFMLAARDFAEQWGAFIEDRMAGFGLVYPTDVPGVHLFHLMGVRPEFRSLGVGGRLFDNFINILPEKGGRKLYWTFDPFDLRNSHLYLNKIGGVVTKAVLDYYGPCKNNHGGELPTHRFICELNFKEEDKIKFEESEELLDIPVGESALRDMETDEAAAVLNSWFAVASARIAAGWLPAGFAPSADRASGSLVLKKRRCSGDV